MKKVILSLWLVQSLVFLSCGGEQVNAPNKNIVDYNYEEFVLPEEEMLETSEKAIQLIRTNQIEEFRALFTEDISKNISEDQLVKLLDQLNLLFQKQGVPTGKENVLPAIQASLKGSDTLFINNIMYKYKPTETEPFPKILTFSFMKEYGSKKLVGVNLGTDGQKDQKPTIEKLEEFVFNLSDISQFRIFYDEGKNRVTKFKNEIGYFAIEGDLSLLYQAGLAPIIAAVFDDLRQSKYEKVEAFNTTLDRGESPSFVQLEIVLKDQPYLIFLYLPIEDNGKYSGEIVFMQKEFANLGYKYILKQSDYQQITTEFPKIGKLNLENFYVDNP